MMHEKLNKITKILCILYFLFTFFGVLLPDANVLGIASLNGKPNSFMMILKWFNYVSVIALPIAVYYKRPTFKKISVYFCSIVAIMFLGFFNEIMDGYTSQLGTGICDIRYLPEFFEVIMKNRIFRTIIFITTNILLFATIALIIYDDLYNEKTLIRFKKEDIINLAIILPLLIISILPPYTLESIFGTYTNIIFKAFSVSHFVWILCIILEVVLVTVIFRKKTKEDCRILVLILAISLLFQFNELFSTLGELTCKRMPLQLCNIAAYITIISIVFNKRKLFLFNALVNIPGALIALIVMDVEGKGILYWSNIHYIVEHHNVIITPLLCLLLGVFAPLKKDDYKSFVAYFIGYYLIVLVFGTTFNALYKFTGSDYFYCNYLFMFDKVTAQRLVGNLANLFDIKISLGYVTLYPIIQGAVFLVFFGIGTLTYFILKKTIKYKNQEKQVA